MAMRPVKLIFAAVDRISKPIVRINRRIDQMTGPIRRARRALIGLAAAAKLDVMARRARLLGIEFAALARRTSLLVAAAAAITSAGLSRFVSAGSQVGKTADKIGLTVEALQELRFAGEKAGIAQRTIDMALQRFTRRAAEAASGTGEARDAIRFLGLQLRDSSGVIRPTADLLSDVADAMQKIESPAVRLRVGFKLFDSEGAIMVNMLRDGSAAMHAARQEARDLGIVLDEKTVRATEKARDEFDALFQRIKGFGIQIAIQVLPAVREITQQLLRWTRTNRDLINTRIVAFGRDLAEVIRQTANIMRVVVPATVAFIQKIGGMKTVLIGVTALFAGRLILSLVKFGGAVASVALRAVPLLIKGFAVLRVALLTNPIGLWITGLTAVAALGTVLFRRFEPFRTLVQGLAGDVKALISSASSALPDSVRGFLGIGSPGSAGAGASIAPAGPSLLGGRSPSVGPARAEVGGTVRVTFDNAPAGMRVTQLESEGGIELDVDQGLSMALP